MANLAQFKKDLKQCSKVFGYVKYSDDDGTEFEMKRLMCFLYSKITQQKHT